MQRNAPPPARRRASLARRSLGRSSSCRLERAVSPFSTCPAEPYSETIPSRPRSASRSSSNRPRASARKSRPVAVHRRAPRVGRREATLHAPLRRQPAGRERQRGRLPRPLEEERPDFFVGGNEAGMMFGKDVRGAEGAVWRRDAVLPLTARYIRVPPILAVEVGGREEGEPELREKAQWYLGRGVPVVGPGLAE